MKHFAEDSMRCFSAGRLTYIKAFVACAPRLGPWFWKGERHVVEQLLVVERPLADALDVSWTRYDDHLHGDLHGIDVFDDARRNDASFGRPTRTRHIEGTLCTRRDHSNRVRRAAEASGCLSLLPAQTRRQWPGRGLIST